MLFARVRHRGHFFQHLLEGQREAWAIVITLVVLAVAVFAQRMWLQRRGLMHSRRRCPRRDDF